MFKFLQKSKPTRSAKQAQRKKKAAAEPVSMRWRKSYNWLFLLVPVMLAGFYLQQIDQVLPIRTIQLSGSFKNLDQKEVEATLRQFIGQGFFSLDIDQVQKTLHEKSWTESVSVRRIWPDKLKVMIHEKVPVARWDERHLLSESARVYLADTSAFSHLPLVNAVNHQPAWILQQYYQLEQRFSSVDERLVAVGVDSRGALDIELINGLQIKFGRQDIEHKINRLVSIYLQQIQPRREQIRRLDLRYSNGFAVAWKKEVLQANDKASIWSNSNV